MPGVSLEQRPWAGVPLSWAHSASSLHVGRSQKNQPNQQKAKNRHPCVLKHIKKKKVSHGLALISLYFFVDYSLCILGDVVEDGRAGVI